MTSAEQYVEPFKNFRFRVKWDGRYVAGVNRITALRRRSEIVRHNEGPDPSTGRKSPGRTEFDSISLERGVSSDPAFESWANQVWSIGPPNDQQGSRDFRKDVVIEVYDDAGRLAVAYNVFRCWVSEYQALPDLDVGANSVAIETIKLEVEGWSRVTSKTSTLANQ
jgi:phage tail-like protein